MDRGNGHPPRDPASERARPLLRPLATIVGVVLAALALTLMLALLAALTLTIRPAREAVLREGLGFAAQHLPGQVDTRVEWPSINQLRFTDLSWTDSSDTLLVAPYAEVQIDLRSLLRREWRFPAIDLRVRRADGPAITRLFAPDSGAAGRKPVGSRGAVSRTELPRTELPRTKLPRTALLRVAIGSMSIAFENIIWKPQAPPLRGELTARCDLRAPEAAELAIERLWVRDSVGTRIELAASVNLTTAQVRLDGNGVLPGGWWYDAHAEPALNGFALHLRGGPARPDASHARTAGTYEPHAPTTRTDVPQVAVGSGRELAAFSADLLGIWRRHDDRLNGLSLQGSVELAPRMLTGAFAEDSSPPVNAIDGRDRLPLPDLLLRLDALGLWGEAPHARVQVGIEPNALIHDARLTAHVQDANAVLDTVWLTGDGITLRGSAAKRGERLNGHADLLITGTGWLAPFVADDRLPDSLLVRAALRASFPRGLAEWGQAALRADALSATLTTSAELRLDADPEIWVAPLELAWRDVSETASALANAPANAPLAAPAYEPRDPDTWGRLRPPGEERGLSIDRLRIRGLAGDIEADGTVPNDLRLRWWADRMPPILAHVLSDSEAIVRMADLWQREGPFTLGARLTREQDVRTSSGGAGLRDNVVRDKTLRGEVIFRLPGPHVWLNAPDLATLEGRLTFDTRTSPNEAIGSQVGSLPGGTADGSPGASASGSAKGLAGGVSQDAAEPGTRENATHLRLDLGRTPWLEEGEIEAMWQGERVTIQRAAFQAPGAKLRAHGGRHAARNWDVSAQMSIDPTAFFAWLGHVAPFLADSTLEARLRIQGPEEALRGTLRVTGPLTAGGMTIPGAMVSASRMAAGWEGLAQVRALALPGGFLADSVSLAYRSRNPRGLLPAWARLNAHASELHAMIEGVIETDTETVIETDTETVIETNTEANTEADTEADAEAPAGLQMTLQDLVVGYHARDLRLAHPCSISIGPDPRRMAVSSFMLSGSLGQISGEAAWNPSDPHTPLPRIHAEGVLDLPPDPPPPLAHSIPADLWPNRFTFDLGIPARAGNSAHRDSRAVSRSEASATASITLHDLPLFGHGPAGAYLTLDLGEDGLSCDLAIAAEDSKEDTLLAGSAHLPIQIAGPRLNMRQMPGEVTAQLRWDGLPVPVGDPKHPADRRLLSSAGRLDLTGTGGQLAAGLHTRLHASEIAALAEDEWIIEAHMMSRGEDLDAPPTQIDARWTRAGRPMATASAALPYRVSWHDSLTIETGPQPLAARMRADTLHLSELNALLPSGVSLDGVLDLDLRADGPPDSFGIGGGLDLRGLQIETVRGTRAGGHAALTFGGTRQAPAVHGQVEIGRGQIRIPDPPKNLHPISGQAELWNLQTQKGAVADSATGAPDHATGESVRVNQVDLDADVTVEIPGGLWILGRGLNVELAGDLRVQVKEDEPGLTGSLRAVGGHLIFLGRTFFVERGEAVFLGDLETDPVLDILLSTRIQGTKINVQVTGRPQDPRLALSSSPEMTEGDIVSFLLFGRTLAELDHDQMSLVQQRATQVAASYGAAHLEARLTQELGVDMVTIQDRGGTSGGQALVIGKYLNPKVLLTYEQLLGSRANFLVNLEYFFSRHFMLSTHYGQGEPSGLEVNWASEY